MIRKLEYPFAAAKVRELRAGDKVSIRGPVFTGRDRLHKYLFEGGKCPVDLKDGALYHCGPVIIRKEGQWVVRAAGPTTSIREEIYMPRIIEQHRLRVIIGKGGMGDGTMHACAKYGCVYVEVVGGSASLLAEAIEKVTGVHFAREFGDAEALWELGVKDFRAVVTMDTVGGNLHRKIRTASRRALTRLLKRSL